MADDIFRGALVTTEAASDDVFRGARVHTTPVADDIFRGRLIATAPDGDKFVGQIMHFEEHADDIFRGARGVFGAPFDPFAGRPFALYGAGRLLTAYEGAFEKWRRSSDNDQQDVWIDGTAVKLGGGEAVSSWLGSDSAYIPTRYDHTQQGHDAVQATLAAQPRAALAGVVDVGPNGMPVAVFSGAQYWDVQDSAGFARNKAALTCAAISRATAASGQAVLSVSATNSAAQARALLAYSPTSTAPVFQARTTDASTLSSLPGAAVVSGAWTRLIGRARFVEGGIDIAVNGAASSVALSPAQNTPNADSVAAVRIGAYTSGALFLTGSLSTVALFPSFEDMSGLDAVLAGLMP